MSKHTKAVVLSSGGIDSTTCLAIAVDTFGADNVSTLTCFYGQRHKRELECAKAVAEYYGVKHYVVDLSSIFQFSDCSLLEGSSAAIPEKSYAEQMAEHGEGKVTTYVPFRNGLFLAAVASLAMSIYPDDAVQVFIGAHADDAAGNAYADCSKEFNDAMRDAIAIGTYNQVFLQAPLVTWNKATVVKVGLKLNAPYHLTWSCYNGGDVPCGRCATCIDRAKAFEANGVDDPALKGV